MRRSARSPPPFYVCTTFFVVWVTKALHRPRGVARMATLVASAIGVGVIVGGMPAFFVELFPTAARYTGFSLGYQLASVASGAVAPIVGVALLARYGSPLAVTCYAALTTVPALGALARAPETRGRALD